MNAIDVQGLSKSYGSYYNLTDVSFSVPKGYITGLIGPNGAGKSTIIKAIMGMVVPDGGKIEVFGRSAGSSAGEYKQNIGYISDENIYYDYLSLEEMKRIIAPFYSDWNEEKFRKYMDLFELPSRKKIKDCSKGMKTKFSIAIALAHHPSLLIMDEPTAGLDPVFRRELLDLLADYILEEANTVLFSTHLTTDLDRVADYVTFINKGRIVFTDNKEDVLERYVIVKGGGELLDQDIRRELLGLRETSFGFEGLSPNRAKASELFGDKVLYQQPTLEDIMYFTAKGGKLRA
ncbi:ABC transporter ATP-binding protein [Paenibacillus sp. alder61]|uniref:ABC transporter ATP-binding protein n=1 Tax=Paenibacillus faecis TaxID=862114 RepID=A0A5D0CWE6_9BACL|nr:MULTISPECIES: ABC transporter ATP-binding protein [Paenibacillus]MCA1294108.1 ABC transporter ATP-binding protein [Paenibacillus sp. alder61]TYA14242.1 ABC transporter ATP-binding protein [Paenibacillus faecis]